ncbi:hypothetical protein ABIC15_001354 [Exiguobacterium sp. PvP048]
MESLIGMYHVRVYIPLKSFCKFIRCMKYKLHMEACRYMMCHNFTCSDIVYTGEINSLSRSNAKISDVCNEYLTRLFLIKPTVQMVWYSPMSICRFSDFTVSVLPTDFRHDSKLPHDTQNTFMIHRFPNKIKHLHVKTTIADFPFMTIMNTLQKEVVRIVAFFQKGNTTRPYLPDVITTAAHLS